MLDINERAESQNSKLNSEFNLLNLYSQESSMTNRFESKSTVELIRTGLPDFQLTDNQIAKVGVAEEVRTSRDQHGVVHKDYLLDGRKVFSDNNNNGVRTRTSFDISGRVEGKKTDQADGSSVATFKSDFDIYRVIRDKQGITVLKNIDGNWSALSDPSESSDVLRTEKEMFTAPKIMGRPA